MVNELAKEIHENAVSHGWWDEPRNLLEIAALCHSEISEAVEEYRAGRPLAYVNKFDGETVYYESDMESWGGTVVELDGNARAIKVGKAAAVPRA